MKHGKPNSRPVTSAICTINMSGLLSNGNIVDVHENFKFQLGDLEVSFSFFNYLNRNVSLIPIFLSLHSCHSILSLRPESNLIMKSDLIFLLLSLLFFINFELV